MNFLYKLTIMILKNQPQLKRIEKSQKQTRYLESDGYKRKFLCEGILEKENVRIENQCRHTRESRQLQKDFSGKAL